MSDVTAGEGQEGATPLPQETEHEVKARRLGWVPKEEFKGDPDKWRPADEFLDRGERLLPLLQRDNDKLHKRLTEMEGLLKDARDTLGEFREFASQSEKRAYERAKAEIQAKIEQGAANADANAVRAGMAELDALNNDRPAPKPEKKTTEQEQPKLDPTIQGWIDREEWFTKDRTLNAFAVDVFGDLERNNPGLSTEERLAETKRLTREKFPEKFGVNPARNGAAAVAEPSGGNSGRKKGKTYDDLPAEAKKACDKFVKTIPNYKREDYVKDYDWEA